MCVFKLYYIFIHILHNNLYITYCTLCYPRIIQYGIYSRTRMGLAAEIG